MSTLLLGQPVIIIDFLVTQKTMSSYLPSDIWKVVFLFLEPLDTKSLLQTCQSISDLTPWVIDLKASKADSVGILFPNVHLKSSLIKGLSYSGILNLIRTRTDLDTLKLYKNETLDDSLIKFALTKDGFKENLYTNFESYATVMDVTMLFMERLIKLYRPQHDKVLKPYYDPHKWHYQNIHEVDNKWYAASIVHFECITHLTSNELDELIDELLGNKGASLTVLDDIVTECYDSLDPIIDHPSVTLDYLLNNRAMDWVIGDTLRYKEGFTLRHIDMLMKYVKGLIVFGDCHLLPDCVVESVLNNNPIGGLPLSLQACGHCLNIPLKSFINYLVTNQIPLRKDELCKLLVKRPLSLEEITYLWSTKDLVLGCFKSKFWGMSHLISL